MTAPNIPSQSGTAPTAANLDNWLIGHPTGTRWVWVLKLEPTDLAGGTASLYLSTAYYPGAKAYPRLVLPSLGISVLNSGFAQEDEGGYIDLDLIRPGEMSVGGFEALNNDGELDAWPAAYGWGNAAATLLFGQESDAEGSLDTFMAFAVKTKPRFSTDEAGNSVLAFETKSTVVNPNGIIQTATFDGSGGLEGKGDIEGDSKPMLYGKYRNIEAAKLQDGILGHMIDPEKVDAIDAVYQGGRNVGVAGTDYTDSGTTDGTFDLVRIPNFGPITCDAKGWTGAGRTASATDYSLAANFTGLLVDQGGASAPTVAGLTQDGGVWQETGAEARFEQVLPLAIAPLGFYWTAQDGTIMYAGELGSPEDGTSAETYTEAHIQAVDHVAAIPPAWKARVGWQPLGTTLSGLEAGGALDEDEITRLTNEIRWSEDSTASVKTNYPESLSLRAWSSLYDEADAATAATALLGIFDTPRDIFRISVKRKPLGVWIGQIVTIDLSGAPAGFPTGGLDTPKQFMVTGWPEIRFHSREPNLSTFVMEIWG